MLVLAAICFWLPHKLQEPGTAHQKIILAQDMPLQSGAFFDKAAIYIAHHNGISAMGFVLNKPGKTPEEPSIGGPVEPEKTFLLKETDAGIEAVEVGSPQALKDQVAVLKNNRREYIVLKGYAGWGIGQLDRELSQERWKVIDRDKNLIFKTPSQDIWQKAQKKPAVN